MHDTEVATLLRVRAQKQWCYRVVDGAWQSITDDRTRTILHKCLLGT